MVLYIIGLVSGLISGMGIGGGTVLIPALVIFVKPEQHIAQSVNLLFFIPTAIIALIVHIKNKLIDFKIAVPIIIAGLAGTYIGSKIAFSFKAPILRRMFGVFLLVMAVYEFFIKDKDKKKQNV